VFGDARERPDLMKAPRIQQPVDPLAHGELAAVVLALHFLRPAHLPGERFAPAQLLDFFFPAHSLSATRPASTTAAPESRCLRWPSLRNQAPISAAKITEVSRNAAMIATGARVIAQSAMPYDAPESRAPAMPRYQFLCAWRRS